MFKTLSAGVIRVGMLRLSDEEGGAIFRVPGTLDGKFPVYMQ
jgi:hypothetical protein